MQPNIDFGKYGENEVKKKVKGKQFLTIKNGIWIFFESIKI